MLIKDIFSVELVIQEAQAYPSSLPEITEDITAGILNVDIVEGNDVYEGPWQQVDTGQFTIVTRNPNLDPKINPNLKYNARIKFNDSRGDNPGVFWTGYITEVNVEYQRNDNPIITITGTDFLGVLQRTIFTEEMYTQMVNFCNTQAPQLLDTGIDFEFFVYFIEEYIIKDQNDPYKKKYQESINFISGFPGLVPATPGSEGVLAYRPARYFPKVGETILEVMIKYAQTNLDYFSLFPGGILIYPLAKYNGAYWPPQQDPAIEYQTYQFSSNPADNKPYESILISNGYNRTINQIEVSNESRFFQAGELKSETTTFGDYTIQESAQDWAATKASLSTILDVDHANTEELERYATDIFQIIAFPSDEIQKITFNNARYEDVQDNITRSFNRINQFVRIKHEVNETQTIDRFYDIAGITHNISPDEWTMGYTLKPSQQEIVFTYQGQVPTLQMNSLTGDTNFNFTATITDYPTEDIDYVLWDLNQIDANQEVYYYPSAFSGEKFKNGLKRTGLTQTWNFDDDGILEPYGVDNPFGRIGAGEYWVTAYLFLKNGFTIAVQKEITVGVPEVHADFVWTQNLTNNFGQVSFTNTSFNHETGEPDSYAWDFGDGTTSALQNPIHVYDPSPSTTEYSVSLTVFAYGEEGEKVYNTKTQTVTLEQPTMTANFTHVQTPATSTITFTNTSTNVGFEEPDAYFWDFGDGQTSTQKNPVHTYGVPENVSTSFNVTLTTRNIWEQTASVTKTITVSAINASGTFPVRYIKFRIDPYTKAGEVTSPGDLVAVTPVMSFVKAITSGTGANLTYLKPILNMNDNYIPTLGWKNTAGNSPQSSLGWEYFLTRDPAITATNAYGLAAGSQNNWGGVDLPYKTVRWELVIDLGTYTNTINQIIVNFQDFLQNGGTWNGLRIENFYPKISVDVANTVSNYTPNPSGVYGSPTLNGNWVNIGYFKLDGGRMDPTKPAGERTSATKTMTAIRPMPLNIPYFYYTFNPFGTNDKQVQFTSVETADSYLWTFGTGATSTVKNPIYTYPDYGTYTVSLQVTNGGVVTRTTTEPVIVQPTVI